MKSVFPVAADLGVERLLAEITDEPADGRLTVGDERVREFLIAFSRRLLKPDLARRHPELGSLGFFLRKGELARAVERLGDGVAGQRRAPRGLVLHFPPANVDTIFVYSWALSALAGNHNIVRVSARAAGAAQTVLEALNDVLADAHPAIAQTQRMVTYDRDDAITGALIGACDLRVLWGGDQSVNELRKHPIRPLARDLAFPDRSSFAAISVAGWQASTPEQRRAAADGFANDLYWFDQAACSSPRDLFWIGSGDAVAAARAEFDELLAEVVARRGWGVDPAMAVEKYVATYGLAATGAATQVTFNGNAVANVSLAGLDDVQRHWLGAGTICHVTIGSLAELAPAIQRKDQTLSQYGFTMSELDDFVTTLAGRGIDRIVPFGQALTFAGTWDGFNLLHEFTRIITIQA
ncbi:gamma-glutamyl phosphate reductase [Dactylosporangium aurantiacum]|uniref:Gamma-glutamyl phosphate reductase n=1 Tax=Dactylosporangium aurantiacum TaxID=35754 RepID=A0A9Q9MJ90_9ACTN|nr:acyl-CoA reductase [Dactylosporangium aurantiacum]MDG6107412.1 acyl-CoA reductase [Dactylosporangium aurantiacum]UWZ54461.1 gamma-glutamyl phosphate reductase [Dactylosporangium aurantiacum]